MSARKFRLGSIPSAVGGVEKVSPSDDVQIAITKMLVCDYSQLPVMTTDRVVKGVISWKSIGTSLQLIGRRSTVQDCMDKNVTVLYQNDRILKAIRLIVDNDYALVKDDSEKITGICTTADVSAMFVSLSEPFLELEQIETEIRALIGGKLEGSEVEHIRNHQNPDDPLSSISEFGFGAYGKWLENTKNWESLDLDVDRGVLLNHLKAVNQIRNEIMHFRAEALAKEDMYQLRRLSKFLRTVRKFRRETEDSPDKSRLGRNSAN